MRKIQDIRPAQHRPKPKTIEPVSDSFSSEEFFAESTLPVPEESVFATPNLSHRTSQPKRKFIGRLIFGLLVFVGVSIFCLISTVEAKNKIYKNFSSLSSGFSSFSEALSSKNLPALANNIDQMNQKTTESILVLQSVGQDIYCFNLIYPQKQASKVTMSVDLIRSAHLITQSFSNIASSGESNRALAADNDYLSGINNYLHGTESYFDQLPKKITYSKYASASAKAIAGSVDNSKFSGAELAAANNLVKLSDLSVGFFGYFQSVSKDIENELGIHGAKKSYLVLFLNNTELRFGGGFIGSFARMDLNDGKIEKLDFETNIYNLDKAAIDLKVPAPKEFELQYLGMRDSNYSPDFAESSKKVMEMYQLESGKKVDGVIAIDTTFFRQLLSIAGPIPMPEYNLTITDENFLTDVQYQVEIAYFQNEENRKENQPKKILSDMMPKLVKTLTEDEKKSDKLSKAISKSISEKHLLIYSANPKIEELFDAVNAGGKIHQHSGDYLYIANANIGGMKSSLNVEEIVDQEIKIGDSGDVDEKITITRDHQGNGEWPDGVNRNLVKVYLPLASNITSIEGNADFASPGVKREAESSFGKSVISFWQTTPPGAKTSTSINYQRKILLDDEFEYPIKIQKQPGQEGFTWNMTMIYPSGWKPENVEGYDSANRIIHLSESILSDATFTLRFIRT